MKKVLSASVIGCLMSLWWAGCETGEYLESDVCGVDDASCLDESDAEDLSDRAASVGLYQAEKFTAQSGCKIATNNAGYTGTGFVDYGGNGTWSEFNNVNVSAAGSYTLKFRYATASGSRQCAIIINGANVGNVAFSATGSWVKWGTASLTKSLKAGNNTIRILANTSSGGPNLDSIEVLSETVATGSCVEAAENKAAALSCPAGQTIASVSFASYGLPTGACPGGFATSSCHAASSLDKVKAACLNKPSCSVAASNGVFGDPCSGKPKKLAVVYSCGGGTVDNCPTDPNKTEPGLCGCGVPEGTCNNTCKNTLLRDERLSAGQYRCSADGRFKFGMSSGGNLALLDGTKTLWSAGTCCGAAFVVMQGDGNLVVYDGSSAKWSSRTAGKAGASLTVENNGTAVIRYNNSIIWSVGSSVPVDNCPNDPNKTEPGLCGCGKPEGTCSNNTAAWKFVVVGDSRGDNNGVNTSVLSHLVNAIIAEKAEFVLFPGDLTTSGSQTQFNTWINTVKPLYDAKIGVYAIRGNHDDANLSAWNNAFSGNYRFPQNGPSNEKNLTYSVVHKNVFFVGLDNYSGSSEVNQSWLNSQLASATQPHVFVFGHEPAFAADHSDTLDDHATARNDFWKSIKNAGGRAYFCGHDHFYDHARIGDGGSSSDDLHQYIVGTAGAPLYNFNGSYQGNNSTYAPVREHYEQQYGYVVIFINGLDVQIIFKKRSGNSYVEVDRFAYTAQ